MAKTFAAFMEPKRFIIMFTKAELNPVYIITRHFLSFIFKISSTSAYTSQLDDNMKVKVKVHSITGHEGPEEEQRYSSALSLT
jgi:hypothetical protein